jgi:hypothetical protein
VTAGTKPERRPTVCSSIMSALDAETFAYVYRTQSLAAPSSPLNALMPSSRAARRRQGHLNSAMAGTIRSSQPKPSKSTYKNTTPQEGGSEGHRVTASTHPGKRPICMIIAHVRSDAGLDICMPHPVTRRPSLSSQRPRALVQGSPSSAGTSQQCHDWHHQIIPTDPESAPNENTTPQEGGSGGHRVTPGPCLRVGQKHDNRCPSG